MVGKRVQFNDESWEDLGALMRKRAPAEASASRNPAQLTRLGIGTFPGRGQKLSASDLKSQVVAGDTVLHEQARGARGFVVSHGIAVTR